MSAKSKRRESFRRLNAGEPVSVVAAATGLSESSIRRHRAQLERATRAAPVASGDTDEDDDVSLILQSLRSALDVATAEGDATAVASCANALSRVLLAHAPPDDLSAKLLGLDEAALIELLRRCDPETRSRLGAAAHVCGLDDLIFSEVPRGEDPDVAAVYVASGVAVQREDAQRIAAETGLHALIEKVTDAAYAAVKARQWLHLQPHTRAPTNDETETEENDND